MPLTSTPKVGHQTFLWSELAMDLDTLAADIAFLGVPWGDAYTYAEIVNDQTNMPAAMRRASDRIVRSIERYDFDLGGSLYDNRPIRAVDCGDNVKINDSIIYTIERHATGEMARRLAFTLKRFEEESTEKPSEWGVRVFGINPSQTRTDRIISLSKTKAKDAFGDENRWEEMLTGLPFNRLIEPEEIARSAAFLASPACGYVSGAVLDVDGGQAFRG